MPRDPREERNGHVLGERKPPEEEDEVDEEDALARAPETLCDDLWTVLGACLRSNGIVRHQIEAFNNFLLKLLPQIVRDHAPITIRDDERGESHVIRMDNARLQGPVAVETDGRRVPMSHTMAMRRNAAYCVTILMDMVHDVYEGEEHVERRVFRDVTLCAMPLMVGSAACYRFRTRDDEAALNENDAGGYFVINGVEKVLIAQERLRTNAPFVFPMSGHPKYQLQCEIRSCAEHKLKSTSTFVVYLTRERQGDDLPELLGSLPFIMQSSLPLQTMFRLIGVTSRDDMINLITGGVGGIPTTYVSSFLVDDGLETMDEETLYEHIAKDATSEPTRERRHRYMDHVLRSEFLPHMGTDGSALTRRRKAQYLGFMVRKLVQVYRGESEPDNRDDYSVKRIDASPCSMLFRQIHRAMVKSMCSTLVRVRESGKLKWTDVSKLWPGKRMSQALRYAFSTGSWGMQIAHRSNGNTSSNTALSASNTGITQVLSRMSMTSTMSNLRRTNTPIAREGKAPKPRQLHTSAWGNARSLTAARAHTRSSNSFHASRRPSLPRERAHSGRRRTGMCCRDAGGHLVRAGQELGPDDSVRVSEVSKPCSLSRRARALAQEPHGGRA
jgi:DNA-directed RNA polymerase II subunit RPB2